MKGRAIKKTHFYLDKACGKYLSQSYIIMFFVNVMYVDVYVYKCLVWNVNDISNKNTMIEKEKMDECMALV